MERAFKMAMRIFLLVTGGAMLMGGGVCAASNVLFMVGNVRAAPLLALLLLISCLIGWAGWWAIKFSGFRFAGQKESAEKTKYPADGESNE